MVPMQVLKLSLPGVLLITPEIFPDHRGFFFESYNELTYSQIGISIPFVQDNISFSKRNTIRGLHYQSTPGQAKLVSCISGTIQDVVVDIRPDSKTFGQYLSIELNDQQRCQLFVPQGFAHGFGVLTETALVQYKVSSFYNPLTECSIRWNDPTLAIQWQIEDPILSVKDRQSPFFKGLS
jgi:dTDP-4-dehydrorhamnose 3,5-epimerase